MIVLSKVTVSQHADALFWYILLFMGFRAFQLQFFFVCLILSCSLVRSKIWETTNPFFLYYFLGSSHALWKVALIFGVLNSYGPHGSMWVWSSTSNKSLLHLLFCFCVLKESIACQEPCDLITHPLITLLWLIIFNSQVN